MHKIDDDLNDSNYYCEHSGISSHKSTRRSCPARISASSDDNERVSVQFVFTHIGHAIIEQPPAGFLNTALFKQANLPKSLVDLSFGERKWLGAMLWSGLPIREILNRIKNGRHSSKFQKVVKITSDGLELLKKSMQIHNATTNPSDLLKIIVGPTEFHASKYKLLKSKSKVLTPKIEALSKQPQQKSGMRLAIRGLRYDVAHEMLVCAYGNPVVLNVDDFEFAKELFFAANTFDVQLVRSQCLQFLINHCQTATEPQLTECLNVADKYHQEDLREVAMLHLMKGKSSSISDSALDKMNAEDLKKFVRNIMTKYQKDMSKLREECNNLKFERDNFIDEFQTVWKMMTTKKLAVNPNETPTLYKIATKTIDTPSRPVNNTLRGHSLTGSSADNRNRDKTSTVEMSDSPPPPPVKTVIRSPAQIGLTANRTIAKTTISGETVLVPAILRTAVRGNQLVGVDATPVTGGGPTITVVKKQTYSLPGLNRVPTSRSAATDNALSTSRFRLITPKPTDIPLRAIAPKRPNDGTSGDQPQKVIATEKETVSKTNPS